MNFDVNAAQNIDSVIAIQAAGLQFGYAGRIVASNASHQWPAGLCLIQGDEGVGKTSWLKVLAGKMALDKGQLHYAFSNDGRLPAHEVFWQNPRDDLSTKQRETLVQDWVAQQAAFYPRWVQAVFDQHAHALGLEAHLHKPLLALSTGSLRKLWLAAGWASGAALTLVDEPFAALDKPSERYVEQALCAFEWSQQIQQLQGAQPRCLIVAHWDEMQEVEWDDVLTLT